jgi:hypothetical protein
MERKEVTGHLGADAVLYDRDAIGIHLNLRDLADPDLHRFMAQAEEIRAEQRERRPVLSQVFGVLAAIGAEWDRERHNQGELPIGALSASVRTDPTAPLDQMVDEYGFAMLLIMPLVEDQSSSAALRGAWNAACSELAREVRVRQFQRLQ